MVARLDLAGKAFGRLTVLEYSHTDKHGKTAWRCLCECGNEKVVGGSLLTKGTTRSCGCLMRELSAENAGRLNLRHGHCRKSGKARTWIIWADMLQRCTDPNHSAFHNYGGRGITVCERWKTYENFLEDVVNVPDGFTLDRTDNEKGYGPDNFRFATRKEQANNKRTNRIIEFDGERKTMAQWAEELGIDDGALRARLDSGMPLERAMTPHSLGQKTLTFDGQTDTLMAWAERTGLPPNTIHKRLQSGWSVDRALTQPHEIHRFKGSVA